MTVSVNHKMNLQDVLMVHFNIRFHREVVIVIVTIIIIILLIIKMIKTIIVIIVLQQFFFNYNKKDYNFLNCG